MGTTTRQTTGGVRSGVFGAVGVRSRERLLVGLAIVSLVVAAFLLPPLGPAAGSGGGLGNATGQNGTPTETEPPEGTGDDVVTPAPIDGGPGAGGEWVTVSPANGSDGVGVTTGSSEPYPDCVLLVWDRLVPGGKASTVLWNDGGPVGSREVWFEDRSVGTTSADGRVDGRVPYVRELAVTAEAPPVDRCDVVYAAAERSLDEWQDDRSGGPVLRIGENASLETVTVQEGNVTATLPVEGTANLTVTGDPYPGEDVLVNATVDGVPMRSATVAVDGTPVGETDAAGHYRVTVPDDGRSTFTVSVSRGPFTAEQSVDVLLLTVDLETVGAFALPGDEVDVTTRIGDRPAPDVTVVGPDGESTTGPDGTTTVRFPADPTAGVTATGHGQVATAPFWPLYLPTVALVVFAVGLLIGTVALARRSEDGPSAVGIAAVWGTVALLIAAWILAGPLGAAIAGLVVLVATAVSYRGALGRGLGRLRAGIAATTIALHGLVLGVADWLGRAADALRAVLTATKRRLAGLPRSGRALVALALRWLAGMPRRGVSWLHSAVVALVSETASMARWLVTESSDPRVLGAVALGAVAVGVAWVLGGVPAGAVVLAVLLVGAVVWIGRQRLARAGRGTDRDVAGPHKTDADGSSSAKESAAKNSLASLWRTFARWIVPGRVRTHTPGEVARAAVARGFPREPVERLTETFRAVEYGDHSLTDDEWGRARGAFEALRTAQADDEGEDDS